MVKVVDTSGNESLTCASCYTDRPLVDENAPLYSDHVDGTWAGNGILIEGEEDPVTHHLQGISGGTGDDQPFWGADGDPFWGADSDPFWPAGEQAYGGIEWCVQLINIPNLAQFMFLTTEAEVITGEPIITYNRDRGTIYDNTTDLPFPQRLRVWGGTVDGNYPVVRIRMDGGNTRPELERFHFRYEGGLIRDYLSGVSLTTASGGNRLTLTKTFTTIASLEISIQEGTNLSFVRVVDKDVTLGPCLKGYDYSGARCAGTIDVIVRGY
jgi:hypothetical protein